MVRSHFQQLQVALNLSWLARQPLCVGGQVSALGTPHPAVKLRLSVSLTARQPLFTLFCCSGIFPHLPDSGRPGGPWLGVRQTHIPILVDPLSPCEGDNMTALTQVHCGDSRCQEMGLTSSTVHTWQLLYYLLTGAAWTVA